MITKCKYIVECDNDCGYRVPCKSKREIDTKISTYRYKSVNEVSDKLFENDCNGVIYKELHFCCPRCAEEYFNYYPERRSHYVEPIGKIIRS